MFRPLPWEYGIRNLFRQPMRSSLTIVGLSTVVVLVFVVVGFIRGLERSLEMSGDPKVALVFSLNMGENLEYSSIPARTSDLVAASVKNVRQRYGQKYASPELYLGTLVGIDGHPKLAMGLVRGVTPTVLLVRGKVDILDGKWPAPGEREILVGRLAATKLGLSKEELSIGKSIELEGQRWKISGIFSARGSVFESELWCRLDDLQQAMKRQDISLVAVKMSPRGEFGDVELFCAEQTKYELQSKSESAYYAQLQEDYYEVRLLAWAIVLMVSAAGVFAGLNTMHGAVLGRVRELATLQTIGFARRAIALSLIQEGLLLGVASSLIGSFVALLVLQGTAVRFTMAAFELSIDSVAILIACGTGFLLGFVGSVPPAIRTLRMPVVEGLKAV